MLKDIEKLIKRKLPSEVIPGFEPDLNAKPQAIQRRSNDAPGRGRQQQPRNAAAKPQGKPPAKTFGTQAAGRPASPHRSGGRGR
jgi:ATP-dependent RNA helicase RhlE